jgi:hypothetical protein
VEEEPVRDELEAALHSEHCSEEVIKQSQGLKNRKKMLFVCFSNIQTLNKMRTVFMENA